MVLYNEEKILDLIEAKIGLHQDFPKKGILFRDIMPVMNDPALFNSMVEIMADRVRGFKFDRVLGIESRGFLVGPLLAQKLFVPFGPIRKKGKLPGQVYSVEYELEYGRDVLEVQKNALPNGSKCLIVDDLVATGGSLEASKKLVEMSGSQATACVVIIELKFFDAKKKLGNCPLTSLFSY